MKHLSPYSPKSLASKLSRKPQWETSAMDWAENRSQEVGEVLSTHAIAELIVTWG